MAGHRHAHTEPRPPRWQAREHRMHERLAMAVTPEERFVEAMRWFRAALARARKSRDGAPAANAAMRAMTGRMVSAAAELDRRKA
jgi:glycogen debranching enzyme